MSEAKNTLLIAVLIAMAGCNGPFESHQRLPGKSSVEEALAAMDSRSRRAVPLRGYGQCRLGYMTDKGKRSEMSFSFKLWFNPPVEVYLHSNVTFGAEGTVCLGSNADEFWLGVRPEISTYWWGQWSKVQSHGDLLVDPRIVIEALGIAVADPNQTGDGRWGLSNRSGQDVLTLFNAKDRPTKRVFVGVRDYLIEKIEYFDNMGGVVAVAILSDYDLWAEAFRIPSSIEIARFSRGRKVDWVRLSLDSVRTGPFSDTLKKNVFTRPEPVGYEHVFEADGNSQ